MIRYEKLVEVRFSVVKIMENWPSAGKPDTTYGNNLLFYYVEHFVDDCNNTVELH